MTTPFWRPPEPSEARDRVLDAVLAHAPFDGWSDKALAAAAADLGIEPDEARRAFPGGALDLIGYHSARADRRMAEAAAQLDFSALGTRQRIAAVLRTRFEAKMKDSPDASAFSVVTGRIDQQGVAFQDLAKSIAAVDTLQAFMADMKKQGAPVPPPAPSAPAN